MQKLGTIFVVLVLCIFATFTAFAQEASPAATPTPKIEYDLPYPGILPDNPLYKLKAFRDRVIDFLISDPLKKAEFNLLNSDKRLWAGVMLIDKKKDDLALSTISKSNNYFDHAISSLSRAKKEGKHIDSLFEKMKLSLKKHRQVLKDNIEKVDKKYQQQLKNELKRLDELEKRLTPMKKSK